MLQLEPFTKDQGRPAVRPVRASRSSASLRFPGLRTRQLARMSDSLVRVSRRADYDHYASILAEARTSPGARCITRGYNTPEGATFLKSYPAAPDDAGLQRGE